MVTTKLSEMTYGEVAELIGANKLKVCPHFLKLGNNNTEEIRREIFDLIVDPKVNLELAENANLKKQLELQRKVKNWLDSKYSDELFPEVVEVVEVVPIVQTAKFDAISYIDEVIQQLEAIKEGLKANEESNK